MDFLNTTFPYLASAALFIIIMIPLVALLIDLEQEWKGIEKLRRQGKSMDREESSLTGEDIPQYQIAKKKPGR